MSKAPIAVLLSDVHYSLPTLEVADKATNMAIDVATSLGVPLVVAGDLTDGKANMRGECVATMLKTFSRCALPAIILRGNHDQLSEKSEEHSLEFLRHLATIVDKPTRNLIPYWTFIPYQNDTATMRAYLKTLSKGTNIIMHQGVQGSLAGSYFMDHTAILMEDIKDFNVLSGHYHTRSEIYLGNPYTLGYGEAKDPNKGFHILNDNNTLEFIPTNLRRHRVWESDSSLTFPMHEYNPGDPVWIKVTDSRDKLAAITKDKVAKVVGFSSFKLDLIAGETFVESAPVIQDRPQAEILDGIIDTISSSYATRVRIKHLWKSL